MWPSGGKEKLAHDLLVYSTLLSQSDRIYINYKMMQFKAEEVIISSQSSLVNVTKLELVINLSFIICRNLGSYAIIII